MTNEEIEARFNIIERRQDAFDRRLRDLEIQIELELPPMENDPRTVNNPPDTSQRFKKEVDPYFGSQGDNEPP